MESRKEQRTVERRTRAGKDTPSGKSRERFMSIRFKIAIPIGLVVLAAIGVMSAFVVVNTNNEITGSYMRELTNVTSQVVTQIEVYLDNRIGAMQFLAGNQSVITMIRGRNYEQLADFLAGYFATTSDLDSLFVSTPQVQSTVVADAVSGASVTTATWSDIGVEGNFERSLAGETVISEPYISPDTEAPTLLITMPVVDGGTTIAILGLTIDLVELSALTVDDVRIGQTGYSAAISKAGYAFAHPSRDLLLLDMNKQSFGHDVMTARSGDLVYYTLGGVEKVMEIEKSARYGFIVSSILPTSEIQAATKRTLKTLLIIGMAGLLIIIALTVLIIHWRLNPIVSAAALADRIAQGDFDVETMEVSSNDEIGRLAESLAAMVNALRAKAATIQQIAARDLTARVEKSSNVDGLGQSLIDMSTSLNSLLRQVNDAVDQVTAGSDQVAQSSHHQSQGATEQASALEEISASLTQINSQAQQNVQFAEHGNEKMHDLLRAMEEINASSDQIRAVVKLIDDIAFQINLLALNANVEAARAGKYGKGFAVVAEEVRNLAGRSGEAVKETTRMVEQTLASIVTGSELARATAEELEKMATASKEQASGVMQINTGLSQIEQVTQSNTASAEEGAAAAQELASQAQHLRSMISEFKLSGNGVSHQGGNGSRPEPVSVGA